MIINKAYKFRIYPNKKQERQLYKEFAAAKSVYNYFLNLTIEFYEQHKDLPKDSKEKKSLNFYDWCKLLTDEKKVEEHKWWSEVASQNLVQSLRDLDAAYKNFFRRVKNTDKQKGFPKFKKFNSSIRYNNQTCKYDAEKHKISLSKTGWIRTVDYKIIYGKIMNITVSKSKEGKWYASISVEQNVKEYKNKNESEIGIDIGIKDFLIDSNGNKVSNPRFYEKSQKKRRRLARQLSRKKLGSNNRKKARLRLAKFEAKIASRRDNFLQQTSTNIIKKNSFIAFEDLNIKGMLKNKKLSKQIADVSWGEFFRQIKYKGEWYDCNTVQINRFEPSSKTCNCCGFINRSLTLKDREWVCSECGNSLDRDVNAARNILDWGKKKFFEVFANPKQSLIYS